MKEPSPFNAFLPDLNEAVQALRNAHLFVAHLDYISIQTPIYRDEPCFEQCHIYCNQTLDLIFKLGIPAKLGYSTWEMENNTMDDEKKKILQLPLRWAAARGPWPEQNETNMCEARLKHCLQCVYYSLLDLMRTSILGDYRPNRSNTARKNQIFVAMKSELSFLSYAWDGVGDWRA